MFQRTTAINKLLKLKKRIRKVPGGTSAGKTYGIIPILIDQCTKTKGLEISIVSHSVPHLKRGAMRDFKKIMKQTGRWVESHWHGTDFIYTFANGSYIEFFSTDQEDKVRGPRRDVLYINECNKIGFETYHQLAIRTRKYIWLDYNPSNEFWVHTELQGDKDVEQLILTYQDNEALEDSIVSEIEKALEKGFYDPDAKDLFAEKNIKNKFWANWWKVYGLGLLGTLEGAIFQNWEYGEFDDSLPYCYGLDFGVKDPDGLIKVAVDRKNMLLYWDEQIYQNGLSTDELHSKIVACEVGKKLIIGDSAAKRTILDLKKKGLNIRAVEKNKILDDIKLIQGYKIIITEHSVNLARELRSWIWLDKRGEVPLDDFNHLIDPGRYATQTLTGPQKTRQKQKAL